MCGGIHYGEVALLVSVERRSGSRGASCVVECTMGRFEVLVWDCTQENVKNSMFRESVLAERSL